MGQVFAFACDEVVEYCASQNATPVHWNMLGQKNNLLVKMELSYLEPAR